MATRATSLAGHPMRDPIAGLRAAEFGRLDRADQVYLDYTGSALYPASLLDQHQRTLKQAVLGNPHSNNPASDLATRSIEAARHRILEFFDAADGDYAVIFTANASAALKLVAESFRFQQQSHFALLADNHNSVNGIREYARRAGSTVTYLPLDAELRLRDRLDSQLVPRDFRDSNLFSFPAQSNFSGVQHDLDLVNQAQQLGYQVMLDAAAYVPCNRLNLNAIRPEFVCVSFYKMFGYPTGVGALIARRDALARLKRPWFAGGVVDFASTQSSIYQLAAGEERFEDGTPDFLAIAAVCSGLDFMDQVGLDRINQHSQRLTTRLLHGLQRLRHDNGKPLIRIYGPDNLESRGATIAFNVRDRNGTVIPCQDIEASASARGISVRSGCFCNPGCSEMAFGIDEHQARHCLSRLDAGEFSQRDFSRCLGDVPVGAVRASVGLANTDADIDRFIAFLGRLY